MRVLVTGGTGVVGQAAVTALLARGHDVRLLSRHAADDARRWPHRLEPWPGDVADAESIHGSAEGCDAVLHLVAIVDETPPDATFERVNVGGTRNIVAEAERAGVKRFVYVSSLGAERGTSPYHHSKLAAEGVVRGYSGTWTVVRPGNVYGPGDEQVSLILKMIRSLPAIPVIGGSEARFQPIWADDVGEALAAVVERDDLAGQVLEIAGTEQVSVDDLVDRLCTITDRHPTRVPLPPSIATAGARVAEWLGISLPVNSGQITMLDEGNRIDREQSNALARLLGRAPTSLDDGLRRLADAQPEQLPDEGVGRLTRKRFWATIHGSRYAAEDLFHRFCTNFQTLTPWHLDVGAEPGTASAPLAEGQTLTMSLPVRGNMQVRVRELDERRMTLITLAGHPLAGAVRFLCEQRADALRFEIQVYDRASGIVDWLLLHPVGGQMQNATWRQTIDNVVHESGGVAPRGVEHETDTLDDEQARKVVEWLDGLVAEGERNEREARTRSDRSADVPRDDRAEGPSAR